MFEFWFCRGIFVYSFVVVVVWLFLRVFVVLVGFFLICQFRGF